MSSYVFNRSGGGGGLPSGSAVIHVRAPAGSTISFTKGGVVVASLGPAKSHVNAADSSVADWYFAVAPANYGSWTVTAALNGESSSASVTVNAAKQYDVTLSYNFYLFEAGTGAVVTLDSGVESTHASVTIGTDEIVCWYTGGQNIQFGLYNASQLDLRKFSTLNIEYDMSSTSGDSRYCATLFVSDAVPGYSGTNNDAKFIAKSALSLALSRTSLSLDISSVNAAGKYVGVRGAMNGNIYNLWLH